MQSKLNPYISYMGQAQKAMEFYQSVFGGKLEMTTFKEGGVPCEPAQENQLMHAMLVADNGITLMASDMPAGMDYQKGTNISMSLSGDNEDELTTFFTKLSEGGKVAEPLKKAPWGDTFGMFEDQFGIFWMVNILGKH